MNPMEQSSCKNFMDNSISPIIHKIDHSIYLKLNSLLNKYDITLQQSRTLTFLWLNKDKDNINQKSIEDFMELKGPSVTSLIHKMVEKNLIKRSQDENDARSFKLELTERGIELHHICFETFAKVNSNLIHNMSQEELQTLKFLLSKIEANIDL